MHLQRFILLDTLSYPLPHGGGCLAWFVPCDPASLAGPAQIQQIPDRKNNALSRAPCWMAPRRPIMIPGDILWEDFLVEQKGRTGGKLRRKAKSQEVHLTELLSCPRKCPSPHRGLALQFWGSFPATDSPGSVPPPKIPEHFIVPYNLKEPTHWSETVLCIMKWNSIKLSPD